MGFQFVPSLTLQWLTAELFLFFNVIMMLICSALAIFKKFTVFACSGLLFVVISQSIGYGLVFDLVFAFRNLSICGGLMILLAEGMNSGAKKTIFAGLPQISENDQTQYLSLAGRVLLVLLFITFAFSGSFSITRVIVSLLSFVSCVMVVIGFKTKFSAMILIAVLSIGNLLLNNWWSLHHNEMKRDFMLFEFFRTFCCI
jgi:uncharacterized membrane protein YphA (DoxX/SURF4 family)